MDDGIRQFTRAMAIDPNLGRAHYCAAVAYLKKGLRDQARREYLRAIEISPVFKEAPYALRVE